MSITYLMRDRLVVDMLKGTEEVGTVDILEVQHGVFRSCET